MTDILTRKIVTDKMYDVFAYTINGMSSFTQILNDVIKKYSANKTLFIRIPIQHIKDNIIDLRKIKDLVIEFKTNDPLTEEIIDLLHNNAIRVCMDNPEINKYTKALLFKADFIKIELDKIGLKRLNEVMDYLKIIPGKKILYDVDTLEKNSASFDAGVDLIQGYWMIKKYKSNKTVDINPSYLAILNVMRLIQEGADIKHIENALKLDIGLSVKLLRYINSVGFGLSYEITSYHHAVMMLGYEKMYKWVSLLLVSSNKLNKRNSIMKLAVIRGRIAELISCATGKSDTDSAKIFMAAEFSLIPQILDISLEQLLVEIHAPKEIKDALLMDCGDYYPYLELAKALEESKLETITTLAKQVGISIEKLNEIHVEAINWVESIRL